MIKNSLKVKMLITIVGVLVLILATLTVFVSMLSYNATMSISQQYIYEQMLKEGTELSRFFEKNLKVTEGMVSAVKIAKDKGVLSRENLNDILMNVLKDQPNIYDSWFVFEPNAFDGLDSKSIGRTDSDEKGRYVPLAYRDGDKFGIEKCYGYDSDPYYMKPKSTLKPFFTEPTVYDISGVSVNMVTVSVPIVIDGKFYGVGGVDIAVEKLMSDINKVKLFKTGYIKLLGSDAKVFAHPDQKQMGQISEEFKSAEGSALLSTVLNGRVISSMTHKIQGDNKLYKVYVPITVSDFGPTWILGALIPTNEITSKATDIRNINFLASIVGLLIIGVITTLYIRNITTWIKNVAAASKEISQGNLNFCIDQSMLKRSDEIGILANSFNHMKDELRQIATVIINTSDEINASSNMLSEATSQSAIAAEDISRAIQEVAQGASDQARDTEKGSEEVLNLGRIIETNQAELNQLSINAKRVMEVVQIGTTSMQKLDQQANRTSMEIKTITNSVDSTYKSVNRIKEVSGLIASISEQTNLLALNASIEAARAGEHGKGFAVVADEIRKLAEQSKNSTHDIDKALQQLNSDAENLVKVSDEINKVVSDQLEGVTVTTEQFGIIRQAIDDIAELIKSIDQGGISMQKKKDYIMEVMTSLSAIAEENAASTEETSASTEEQSGSIIEISQKSETLALISVKLKEVAAYFKI